MRKIIIVFLSIFIFLTSLNIGHSETPLPKTVKEKPAKYQLVSDQEDIFATTEVLNYQVWTVYSDRENNITYTEPGGTERYGTLHFMEQFYVADEKEDYVRLVRDLDIKGINLSPNAIDFGWINKDKLLLWNHCLVTPPEKGNINKKAMVLNTLAHIKTNTLNAEADKIKFRKGVNNDSPLSGKETFLYQIFYVYKEEGDMVLLGREERIDDQNENTRRQNIMGWAPSTRLTYWDHRVALEPNWEPRAIEERKRGKSCKFFIDVPAAKKYANGDAVGYNSILWDSDFLGERPIGEWRRFPFLRNSSGEYRIAIAGVMGEVHPLKNGKVVVNESFSSESVANITHQMDNKNAKRRLVNIVFVVDGTSSMEPYFMPISQAIEKAMKELKNKNTRNKYKFGAAVYRDWAEGRERLINTKRLNSDHTQISQFLKSFDADDIYDEDQPEAVYYGLKNALRNIGLKTGETNIIVLVGDAGNHNRNDPSQVDQNELIDLLVDKECHFLTLQVHHKGLPAYDDLISQSKSLILGAAEKVYTNTNQLSGQVGVEIDSPEWNQPTSNIYKLINGYTVGWILGQNSGNSMPPSSLGDELEKFILAVDDINNRYVAAIQDIIDGGSVSKSIETAEYEMEESTSKYVSSFAPGILHFLKTQGLDEQQLQIVSNQNFQIYTRGTAPMYIKGQKHPLFKEVLLLTRRELFVVWDCINKLIVAGSIDEQREKMVSVWKELLKEHIGEVSNQEMDELSMEEIYEKLFGLPSTSDFLRDITLRDILDRGKFPDKDFAVYVERIKSKEKQLHEIINMEEADYKYCFRSNEQPYYWISQDVLP